MMKKIKGLPHFSPGLFYAAACVTCDNKIFLDFYAAFHHAFYPLKEEENNTSEYFYSDEGHKHILLSIPIGDMHLMRFMLEGTFNGEFIEIDSSMKDKENVKLIRFLPKDKLPPNPLGVGLGFWQMRRYDDCFLYLKDSKFSHPFCLFLAIRCRLLLPRNRFKDPETILLDTGKYLSNHECSNGIDSEQYGVAVILDALALVWLGYDLQIAKKKLETALTILQPLKSLLVGFVHYSLGTIEESLGNSVAAFARLKETDRHRFPLITTKYIKAHRYAWANWFASRAFMDDPNTKNIMTWSVILWKLDIHQLVRRLLSIGGAKEFQAEIKKLGIDSLSNERVCCNCEKGGDVMFFLRCPNCKKDWYCSQTCIDMHAERHRPFCSWCGNCDKKLGRGQRQWCSGCNAVFYCGPDCQAIHWEKEHKDDCLRAAEVVASIFLRKKQDTKQVADAGIVTEEHLRQMVNEIDEHLKSSKQWLLEQGNKPPF